MWLQDASREDLIDIVQSNGVSVKALKTISSLHELPNSKSELLFVWNNEPLGWKQLPSMIVINNLTPKEFFAWTGTYLLQCRPVSAFCRVINRERLHNLLQSNNRNIIGKIASTCIGLIIGEIATYLLNSFDMSRLHAATYGGSYYFAQTQAVAKNIIMADELNDRWQKARRLTGQKQLALSQVELDQAWNVVLGLINSDKYRTTKHDEDQKLINAACKQIFENGDIDDTCWHIFAKDIFSIDFSQDLLKGPREERVLQVEQALTLLCDRAVGSVLKRTFFGGYIASRIAPGTFDHHAMLTRYVSKLPALLVWYGLCAGLTPNSKVQNLGAGVGRRIIRDAAQEDDILYRPKCDISLEELEVLQSSGKNNMLSLYPREAKYLTIEIMPCVNTMVRNINGTQSEAEGREVQTQLSILSNYRVEELKKLTDDLERAVNAVNNIQMQMKRELFLDKRKRR